MGWTVKKLGFIKERVGKGRQRIIRWDEDRVHRLSPIYGLATFKERTSTTSATSALAMEVADVVDMGDKERPPKRPPVFEAKPTSGADVADKADNLYRDKGDMQDNDLEELEHELDKFLAEMGEDD